MPEVTDSIIHWVLAAAVPSGGALFLFLLKRTFADFEMKVAKLFSQMEDSLAALAAHDKRIDLLQQRVESLEDQKPRRRR